MKHNSYFNGAVQSLGFDHDNNGVRGSATIGVMGAGEYEFSTGAPEKMDVVSGVIEAKLPGAADWRAFKAGESFNVPGNSKFNVRLKAEAAYVCWFG